MKNYFNLVLYNAKPKLPLFATMKGVIFVVLLFQCMVGFSQLDSIFHVVDIRVEGNLRTHEDAIIIRSKLKIDTWIAVPGAQTVRAIKTLWATGDYKTIKISRINVPKGIELIIQVEEYFRLGNVIYQGLLKSEIRKMDENSLLQERKVYNPQTIKVIESELRKLLAEKGYVKNKISLDSVKTVKHSVALVFSIVKGDRFRVSTIAFEKSKVSYKNYKKSLIKMRPKFYAWPGSLYENNAKIQIKNLEDVAKNKGYPYAEIDSVNLNYKDKKVDIKYLFNDATQYTFGSFIWEGNKAISDTVLNKLAATLSHQLYSNEMLNNLLYFSDNYKDVSSLYYEKGYASMRLYHQLIPNKEAGVIDVKVGIMEGKIMRFGNISFSGNIRTKEFILLREVLTAPGEKFSRSKIIISQQKLAQLEYFQNTLMDVKMKTDTAKGTVDINYIVKEKISDKLYISGGYGSRLVGTVGFSFKNFSGKDLFKKHTRWNPLPAGGGQQLSLKGQTDGIGYYGGSFNFYEPWLKGKPIGLSFNTSYASINDSIGHLGIFNLQTTISHKPFKNDPFTYVNYALGYRQYNADNFNVFGETSGRFNALTLKVGVLKNTTYGGSLPVRGSRLETSLVSSLPPYSLYSESEALTLSTSQKFNWFEYYKFKISYKHYQSLNAKKDVILATKFGLGYIGFFNKNIGTVPFERFYMGGTGLTNFDVTANEFIGLRGYESGDISSSMGDALALKLTFELQKKWVETDKIMFSTHLFGETGNTYATLLELDPSNMKTSFGVGARIFAPIIGVFGVDIGWGINKTNFSWKTPAVQFTIGMDIGDF